MLYNTWKKSVQAFPDQAALFFAGQTLTYRECDQKIEEIAKVLQKDLSEQHPKKNGLLIYCKKSFSSILWQLAVNRINQVFINIDILTPCQRVDGLIAMTEPLWIFTDQTPIELPEGVTTHYIPYGETEEGTLWKRKICSRLIDNLNNSEDITHIYFSSGSTGVPKAILLNDKAIISVVGQQAHTIKLNSSSKFAWLLSPAFDASLSDIYTTLLSGACLYICDFPMTKIKTLINFFNSHNITHTDLSPSILGLISPKKIPTLKSVIFGGEVSNTEVIFQWEGVDMFNAYGPTETTICSSLKKVNFSWHSNNIGQPLNGVEYHLHNLAQTNARELYIAGNHLAIGYIDERLTREKFISINGKRYYRTGDLVKLDESGDYLFVGRVDRQLKLHGILICPEEIKNYARQSGCLEALCKLEDKLTLYYRANVPLAKIKESLQQLLPATMLPQKWIEVESLTKNINGKVQL